MPTIARSRRSARLSRRGYTHGRSPWAFTRPPLQSSNRNDLTRQGRAGILAVPNAFDATHRSGT